MAEIGKAYVQIIPKATGISSQVEKTIGGGGTGTAAGQMIGGNIKKALAAAAIATPIVAGLKAALGEGAKLEQSFGGLDTIYGDASKGAKKYAWEAAKAGISANDYAEQAVSFGASLKQAFKGDTTKAVEAANTAIMDMTDNAAKMGTPLDQIQHAYQGFAKQNYTMLDNLKLGYGGTKTEMERLLADASKISGQKYDMSNLGDVYAAIHVIQGELGLTGVAAAEAEGTFTGSMGAMVASAKNLGAIMAQGGDLGPAMKMLAGNAAAFLFNNLVPSIGRVIKQIPNLVGTFISTAAPMIQAQGMKFVTALASGITMAVGTIQQSTVPIINKIGDSIIAAFPIFMAKGAEIISSIGTGIVNAIPQFATYVASVVTAIGDFLAGFYSTYGENGSKIAEELASGFVKGLPKLLVNVVMGLGKVSVAIVKALVKVAPQALIATQKISQGIYKGLAGGALTLIKGAMNKIKTAMEKPLKKAQGVIKGIMDKIKGFFPLKVGKILTGIKIPHINVSGGKAPFGIGGKGTKPSISVSWYAKGGIFDNPSLVGIGEKGPEAVIPLSGRNMRPFAETIAREIGGGGTVQNFYITMEGSNNAQELAENFIREVKMRTRTA